MSTSMYMYTCVCNCIPLYPVLGVQPSAAQLFDTRLGTAYEVLGIGHPETGNGQRAEGNGSVIGVTPTLRPSLPLFPLWLVSPLSSYIPPFGLLPWAWPQVWPSNQTAMHKYLTTTSTTNQTPHRHRQRSRVSFMVGGFLGFQFASFALFFFCVRSSTKWNNEMNHCSMAILLWMPDERASMWPNAPHIHATQLDQTTEHNPSFKNIIMCYWERDYIICNTYTYVCVYTIHRNVEWNVFFINLRKIWHLRKTLILISKINI